MNDKRRRIQILIHEIRVFPLENLDRILGDICINMAKKAIEILTMKNNLEDEK